MELVVSAVSFSLPLGDKMCSPALERGLQGDLIPILSLQFRVSVSETVTLEVGLLSSSLKPDPLGVKC